MKFGKLQSVFFCYWYYPFFCLVKKQQFHLVRPAAFSSFFLRKKIILSSRCFFRKELWKRKEDIGKQKLVSFSLNFLLYTALLTREKFYLVWLFLSLEGQRRCFAVADEFCSGHSWIEQDTIHWSSEANPIQYKGPSSLGLKEDSPDLDSSPTHTELGLRQPQDSRPESGARCCCLYPQVIQWEALGMGPLFLSSGLISYFPFRHCFPG